MSTSSLRAVLFGFCTRPVETIVRRWNWKSAVMSSAVRSSLFFAANLSAGVDAAMAAFLTELAYRGISAGFYGALTQGFRQVEPAWVASVAAMIVLPTLGHGMEWLVHWLRGTENLAASVTLSVAMTMVSTAFNIHAMRRGALIVGEGSSSLTADLARMPSLVASFVGDPAVAAWRNSGLGRSRPSRPHVQPVRGESVS